MSNSGGPRVTVTRLAKMDIQDAFVWYDARSPDLGEQFVREVDASLLRIAEYPAAAPLVWKERVRQFVMPVFPYSIFYVYRGNRVRIAAVMHQRRDPRDWQMRVR